MKKGFTLVELLVTLVILGILIAVLIPVVNIILKNQEERRYDYHEEIVVEATKTYIDEFSDRFDDNNMCFDIEYRELLEKDLLKEDVISCDVSKGSALGGIIQVKKEGDSYQVDPYLTCKNLNKNKIVVNKKNTQSSMCTNINDYFIISKVIAKYDSTTGSDYNFVWTNRNVYLEITTNDPLMVGFKEFEYSVNNGQSWKKVVGNNVLLTEESNGNLLLKAYDKIGTVSAEKRVEVKIDKTPPTKPIINLNGYVPGSLVGEVKVNATATDNLSGINRWEYSNNQATWQTVTMPWTINVSETNNYYVRAIDNAGNISVSADKFTIEAD